MSVGTTLQLRPDRWAAGGEAIGRDADGRVVFVRGALPGELVDVEITEERRDWARGELRAVVEPSAHRVVPPCGSRRAGCGGCGWMHLDPAAQVDAKQATVADALARIGRRRDVEVGLSGSIPAAGYRTTLRVRGDADGRAGFLAEHSHDVVAAPACLVAHPQLAKILAGLTIASDTEVALRYSVATGAVGAWWEGPDEAVSGLPDDAVIGRAGVLYEDVAGVRLQVANGSFFQSGPAAAELLVGAVRAAAPELARATTMVDAYAGVGMFAACAAPEVPIVFAVESNRSAVADAARNLRADPDREVVIHRGEVGGWHAPPDANFDVVVADPARSGLGKPGSAALARLSAPVLVLVSCDPASLGRDVRLLAEQGYDLRRCDLVDTFPETPHVETVARFELVTT